jgi:hypothetical protein
MLDYFGVPDMLALRETLKREKGTYDADGKSYYFKALEGLNIKIDEELLERYDQNIKSYLNHINKTRSEKIQLKYFQYLSVLFTEIFLDNRFNRDGDFLKELNDFVERENRENKKNYPTFSKDDLSKLAYWMATGSGKTLVMHINWLQFRKYNKKRMDNILLITPNESLSKQHLEELKRSSIPAKIFSDADREKKDVIQIIEIHKLVEEKKGKGVSVEVSSFEGNNLVFVDEGHKGFSGRAWKSLRDKISEIGFTFEYSATFDEAISSKKDELVDEYAKAIIMDYSYAHFYYDGFGKEFTVLNLKDTEYQTHKELILVANLLSFYQQSKYYRKNRDSLRDFHFERPLWVFVGNSVSSQKGDRFDEDTLSDLQFVVAFFNKFLAEKKESINRISDIMNDKHPLNGKDGEIPFSKILPLIKGEKLSPEELYDDILEIVFNSEHSGRLELFNISNAAGEIGLKVSTAKKYFALVYIGDVVFFRKKLEAKHDMVFRDDKFSDSIFNAINTEASPINILIGSRKFIEGWNSFRVSAMGLLNMGKSKGSQIIQLFGRGVRLHGYNNLMKRSKMLVEERVLDRQAIPPELGYLETLNIFGIKADYVDNFRKQLEEEGISEEEIINLEIKKNPNFLKRNLITLKQKDKEEFTDVVILEYSPSIPPIRLDLRPKFEMFESIGSRASEAQIEEATIPLEEYIDYFDWDKIYFELYNYKQQKGFYNLHLDKDALLRIMGGKNYKVILDKTFDMKSFEQLGILQNLCLRILQKYITELYNIQKRKWITDRLEYGILTEDDENFQDYRIVVEKKEEVLIGQIKKLIKDANKIYEEDRRELPSIVFDRHLYQPLIIKSKKVITIPTGLNGGEERLVKDMREYFLKKKDSEQIKKLQFYIFRNHSKKGIGFFAETNNFYPDFILWVIDGKKQKIAFIDPKGLIHGPAENIAKIKVNKTLKEIESRLERKDVELYSFIVAGKTSSFEKIKGLAGMETKAEFENNHVVFQEDADYVDKIITRIAD